MFTCTAAWVVLRLSFVAQPEAQGTSVDTPLPQPEAQATSVDTPLPQPEAQGARIDTHADLHQRTLWSHKSENIDHLPVLPYRPLGAHSVTHTCRTRS